MRNKAGSRTSAPDPALFSAQLAECVPEWRLVGGASCVVYCISCAFACGLPRHKYWVMLFTQLYAYADEPGGDVYLHGDLIWCGETPECKQSMAMCGARWGCR